MQEENTRSCLRYKAVGTVTILMASAMIKPKEVWTNEIERTYQNLLPRPQAVLFGSLSIVGDKKQNKI